MRSITSSVTRAASSFAFLASKFSQPSQQINRVKLIAVSFNNYPLCT
nr:MAG TPA: hypothetical protein [Caudoviricetes sp.]